ncbi:MAG: hypothetical protein JNL82_15250 [Myxococcales bacterium]|nr:hypothetical protein [Myxococcales bacterium]
MLAQTRVGPSDHHSAGIVLASGSSSSVLSRPRPVTLPTLRVDEVRSALRQGIDHEARGAGRLAVAALQHFGGDAVVDRLLDVDYQNFILFSRTTMDGNVVSVGVLGQVLVALDLSPQGKRRPSR